jgi:hypothetical protein
MHLAGLLDSIYFVWFVPFCTFRVPFLFPFIYSKIIHPLAPIIAAIQAFASYSRTVIPIHPIPHIVALSHSQNLPDFFSQLPLYYSCNRPPALLEQIDR